MKCEQPQIKELAERQVAFVSYTGNYIGNSQVFEDLFKKLCGWAAPKGLINSDSVFLSAYQDDPNVTPPDELKLEVCLSVSEDTEVSGEVEKKVLPGGKFVSVRAELDSIEEYFPAWSVATEWAEENNYKIDMSRPSFEIYLNNPKEDPQGRHIIEICLGVKE
jgi:AraC family transcriptional regulator